MNTNTPPVGTSAVQWARENGEHFTYRAALDNHEPTRAYAYGTLHTYKRHHEDGRGIVLENVDQFRDAQKSMFLVDDGRTVTPHYVAGWNDNVAECYVTLHPFPTDFNADGTRRLRGDDGRPIDMSSWQLGPARCYHLKVAPRPNDPLYELLDN